MAEQRGFFDLDERYAALSAAGDPLERLALVVDFEVFRPDLDAALARSDRAKGGRPPYDAVLMFRILVLQVLYGLSDDQAEFQILDRRSFGRFLGLDDGDKVPDAKTIWLFRETLTRAGAVQRLFDRFDAVLNDRGYLAMGGQIVILHTDRWAKDDVAEWFPVLSKAVSVDTVQGTEWLPEGKYAQLRTRRGAVQTARSCKGLIDSFAPYDRPTHVWLQLGTASAETERLRYECLARDDRFVEVFRNSEVVIFQMRSVPGG